MTYFLVVKPGVDTPKRELIVRMVERNQAMSNLFDRIPGLQDFTIKSAAGESMGV
jgi:hypothetical protein